MIACQAEGCDPIVRAFEAGERHAERVPHPVTCAAGIRVPVAVGDFMILDAVRESKGLAMRGSESKIQYWMKQACQLEGLSLCPESAVCLDVLAQLVEDGGVSPTERIVLFNTGAAQKYIEVLPDELVRLDPDADAWWSKLV